MRRPLQRLAWICALALVTSTLLGGSDAWALPDATPDGEDRFPFVVAIKAQGSLICSGTVLYPRIVVTAAHCLQQVIAWRGLRFYADAYLPPEMLSVSVVQGGEMKSYTVAETAISPGWLDSEAGQRSGARLPYDLALLVTDEPIGRASWRLGRAQPLDAKLACWRGAPSRCAGGLRRGPLLLRRVPGCRRAALSRCCHERWRHLLQEPARPRRRLALLRLVRGFRRPAGDSGGALLVEAPDGMLHYAGVISAGSGLPPALASVGAWRQTAAASLASNLDFIEEKARALGYAPITSGP